MSRIGKKPISIPNGVHVDIQGNSIKATGPKGEIAMDVHPIISVALHGSTITLAPKYASKKSKALWGLSSALVANVVHGVSAGFERKLIFEGIGFRVQQEGDKTLVMQLGFSHPVRFTPLPSVFVSVEKNMIIVRGVNKGEVGNTAAQIRALKPPEPYKGKGIRYADEIIRRKAGKKATGTTS